MTFYLSFFHNQPDCKIAVFSGALPCMRYIQKCIRGGLASCPTLGLSASCLSLSLLPRETNASVWLLSITDRPLHHPSRITSTSCTHGGKSASPRGFDIRVILILISPAPCLRLFAISHFPSNGAASLWS